MIASADLDILSCNSTKFDKGLPSISFISLFLLYQYFSIIIPWHIQSFDLTNIVFTNVSIVTLISMDILFFDLTPLHYRSLLWLGPALLFSTATAVSILGWDSRVRTVLSISLPCSGIIPGDYLLLIVKSCLSLPWPRTVFTITKLLSGFSR